MLLGIKEDSQWLVRMVEIKLIDRLKVLQQLAEALGSDDAGAEAFLRALAPEQEQV